jgi:hypothetical protein
MATFKTLAVEPTTHRKAEIAMKLGHFGTLSNTVDRALTHMIESLSQKKTPLYSRRRKAASTSPLPQETPKAGDLRPIRPEQCPRGGNI